VTTALRISTDPAELDVALIHAFLSTQSTWARGIPLATLQRAIAHSLCFGAYRGRQQVGFARVVSDRATFAQLLDVFVLPEHRGQGCARALLQAVIDEPALQGLRRFALNTSDAHALYAAFGFALVQRPETAMERFDPAVYTRRSGGGKPIPPPQRRRSGQ